MSFGVAEIVCISLAVLIVAIPSHHSSAVDRRTALNPVFWIAIVVVAALLYGAWLAIAWTGMLVAPVWRLPLAVAAGLAALGACLVWTAKDARQRRERLWALGRIGAVYAVAPLAAYHAARAGGMAEAQWAALGVLVAGGLGLWLVRWLRERARDASVVPAAFAPLLERWNERFPANVHPLRLRAAVTHDGIPVDLELEAGTQSLPDGWLHLRLGLRTNAEAVKYFYERYEKPRRIGAPFDAEAPRGGTIFAADAGADVVSMMRAIAARLAFEDADHDRLSLGGDSQEGVKLELRGLCEAAQAAQVVKDALEVVVLMAQRAKPQAAA